MYDDPEWLWLFSDHYASKARRAKRRAKARYMKRVAARRGLSVKNANHMCACSCASCCNPRHSPFSKSEKLTMQERRALIGETDHVDV